MDRNPLTRLGASGADEIKKHEFFNDINWDDIFNKRTNPDRVL